MRYLQHSYHEEHEDSKQIHVFNSKSDSIGETLIGLKIQELEEYGASFEEIVTEVESYISSMNTFFGYFEHILYHLGKCLLHAPCLTKLLNRSFFGGSHYRLDV